MALKHLLDIGVEKTLAKLLVGEIKIENLSLEETVGVYELSFGKFKTRALKKVGKLMVTFEKAVWVFNNSSDKLRILALKKIRKLMATQREAIWVVDNLSGKSLHRALKFLADL